MLQHSFLTNTLTTTSYNYKSKKRILSCSINFISCKHTQKDEQHGSCSSRRGEKELAKLAIVTLAAGVLTLGSVGDSLAAKTGGRVGGQAFRSSAPRSSSPRINNSRTNIYINPPVAPPLVGGYGYGYGGWGWSPFSFFAPGPSVAIGAAGGFDLLVLFMFVGAVAAVLRKFRGPRDEEDDY